LTMTALIGAAVACMFNFPVPRPIVRVNPVDAAQAAHDARDPAIQTRS
jgi:hypothetical protein